MTTQTAKPIRLVTRAERLAENIRHAELVHKILCIRPRRPSQYHGPTFRRDQLHPQPMPKLTLAEQAATVVNGEKYRGPKRDRRG